MEFIRVRNERIEVDAIDLFDLFDAGILQECADGDGYLLNPTRDYEAEVVERLLSGIFASNRTAIRGLPVAGYKPTQPPEAIAAVNVFTELEERALRHVEALERGDFGKAVTIDKRFLAIGRTELQMAFMALNRAIFQPQRIALPGDPTPAS